MIEVGDVSGEQMPERVGERAATAGSRWRRLPVAFSWSAGCGARLLAAAVIEAAGAPGVEREREGV